MKNKFFRSNAVALACLALLFLSPSLVFSQSQAVDYLCQKGEAYYEQGKIEEALSEFNKALLVDPENKTAKKYVNLIFNKNSKPVIPLDNPVFMVKATLSKDDAMATAISELEQPKLHKADGFADAVKKDLDDEEKRGFL
ncbi:MAG: tetratricopeptide repeat protein, partial [Candidatus Omnitrophota bacterium]